MRLRFFSYTKSKRQLELFTVPVPVVYVSYHLDLQILDNIPSCLLELRPVVSVLKIGHLNLNLKTISTYLDSRYTCMFMTRIFFKSLYPAKENIC